MNHEEVLAEEKKIWTRSAPADPYYERDPNNPLMMRATSKLTELCDHFEAQLIQPREAAKLKFPPYVTPKFGLPPSRCKKHAKKTDSEGESQDEDDVEDDDEAAKNESLEWLRYRQNQPNRLHQELWENRSNEFNDGPTCRCSVKAREHGIRHGIYQGEKAVPELDPATNNSDKLYHYRIAVTPPTNFLVLQPTTIHHDEHEFIFEGFSLFTTEPLQDLPPCKVVRFNIEYSILYLQEKIPDNFTLRELKLFHRYFFTELLELLDWDTSDRFYFMPRFVRDLSEDGKEILSMNEVMKYLIKSYSPLVMETDLMPMLKMSPTEWVDFVEKVKGMLVTKPGLKPSAFRIDQLDREQDNPQVIKYPEIVHFGTRPPQLCYAGNPDYQKAWREFVKYRHLLANMAKPTFKEKRHLEVLEEKLLDMRSNSKLKRDVTIAVGSEGFFKTGLMSDIAQHGMLLPVLVNHLRLYASLDFFQGQIGYTFKNRHLLHLAVTHPSYRENYGTNPDHARTTLSNCGIRQPEYGDKKVLFANNRKRGINMLINIMSRFGKNQETESKVPHNERLEFLGDAVVEFITSVHLFYMFPDLEEGGLATYRGALVQNQHLAILAEVLGLENYMLYAHGSDLCHDAELRHAMANCFEAVMGAIYLDGGIEAVDEIFAKALFGSDPELHQVWTNLTHHPLQIQEPKGDRHWIPKYPILKKLAEFEDSVGVEFTHIRLLARAFTDRSLGLSVLTLGSNQRLEFLGDTVLQLITSNYLYRHFPEHHEGHLSLLRSSIVNNRTQAVVCDDIGISIYAQFANPKHELKVKDRADLLEAFLGALYIDKDLDYCTKFAEVCFFPRLTHFIVNQEWNDPKSKLQQCCLTLRTMNGSDPDIPNYKVVESKGPTNTRVYTVAVYFRGDRLANADGHSIQDAEMKAAKLALENCAHLFPHLTYQKKIVERSLYKQNKDRLREEWHKEVRKKREELGLDDDKKRASNKVEIRAKEEQLDRDHYKKMAQIREEERQRERTNLELKAASTKRQRRSPSWEGSSPPSNPDTNSPPRSYASSNQRPKRSSSSSSSSVSSVKIEAKSPDPEAKDQDELAGSQLGRRHHRSRSLSREVDVKQEPSSDREDGEISDD